MSTIEQREEWWGWCELASSGPWTASLFGHSGAEAPEFVIVHHGEFDWAAIARGESIATLVAEAQGSYDANFIAHAREALPILLEEVEALRSQLAAVRAATERGNLMTPPWVLDELNKEIP